MVRKDSVERRTEVGVCGVGGSLRVGPSLVALSCTLCFGAERGRGAQLVPGGIVFDGGWMGGGYCVLLEKMSNCPNAGTLRRISHQVAP